MSCPRPRATRSHPSPSRQPQEPSFSSRHGTRRSTATISLAARARRTYSTPMNIGRLCWMCVSVPMIMRHSRPAWTGRSTSRHIAFARASRSLELTRSRRIDLESGEKTVLSKHAAPVRCVTYSRSHCKFTLAHCCAKLTRRQPFSSPRHGTAVSTSTTSKTLQASPSELPCQENLMPWPLAQPRLLSP